MNTTDDRSLWIVVPAYNEATQIKGVLADLKSVPCRVVVVDDGSSDGTGDQALAAGAVVLTHVVNLGQGAALQTGIEYALSQGATHICTFDGDGQHCAKSIPVLLGRLEETNCEVVVGSRTLGATVNMPLSKRLVWRLAVFFTRRHCGLAVTDTHNGLRLLTRSAAQKIRLSQPGMAHASEFLQQVRQRGLKFAEAPVTITYTEYSVRKGQTVFQALRIVADLFYAAWCK